MPSHPSHGMFALVLVDEATGEYVAARDSVGIKPLYFGTTKSGRQMFASELKAIHDHCDSVQLFPPGHYYTKATGFVKFYSPPWDADDADLPPVTDDEVRGGLIEAVRLRMMSDVPYGALLSGGLDSCITCRYVRGGGGCRRADERVPWVGAALEGRDAVSMTTPLCRSLWVCGTMPPC